MGELFTKFLNGRNLDLQGLEKLRKVGDELHTLFL